MARTTETAGNKSITGSSAKILQPSPNINTGDLNRSNSAIQSTPLVDRTYSELAVSS